AARQTATPCPCGSWGTRRCCARCGTTSGPEWSVGTGRLVTRRGPARPRLALTSAVAYRSRRIPMSTEGAGTGGVAVGARADDLHGVPKVHEAVARGDRLRPALHGRTFDLDGVTALPADQVVVMVVGAPSVDDLAGLG